MSIESVRAKAAFLGQKSGLAVVLVQDVLRLKTS